MPTSCCVYGCDNTLGKSTVGKLHFYNFPNYPWEKDRKAKWISFVLRINTDGSKWQPSSASRICSAHFIGNSKSQHLLHPSFNPSIQHPLEKTDTSENAVSSTLRHQRSQRRCQLKADTVKFEPESNLPKPTSTYRNAVDMGCQTDDVAEGMQFGEMSIFLCLISSEACTQVDHKMVAHKAAGCEVTTKDKSCGDSREFRRIHFNGYEAVKENETALKSLTNVPSNVFSLFMRMIPKTVLKSVELRIEDKLLLFLMKIKLGISFTSIGVLFGIHRTTVSKTFYYVLYTLATATKNWIFWPTKEIISRTMPLCFKQFYPNCTVIIDCTEMKTERPTTIPQQILMWSDYKSSYTIKYLIGITPEGLIMFLSKGYGGRASDSFITNDSGFLKRLQLGDTVMADKGFPQIQADLNDKNVLLVMPPFADPNSPQFPEAEMESTYRIASVRIHVERVIQRIKIFNILNNRIATELLPHMDEIMHICCILANLQSKIIKDPD